MKNISISTMRRIILFIPIMVISFALSAQEKSDYDIAKDEIISTFGTFPSMFEAFPSYALSGAWESFKLIHSPDGTIPPKYRELIQLAVAAQIPCDYCIYYHTASAQVFGATDEEIKEAIAYGATTRHWSMILQGNQVDFEEFKVEFNAMMKFMAEKNQK